MFDRELASFAFTHGYATDLMADVTDDDLCVRPTPKMSHAAWLIGHLTVVHGRVAAMYGADPRLDASWHDLFKPGTPVAEDASIYPSRDELMAAYDAGHAVLPGVVRAIPAETLAEPNPRERLRAAYPTTGDFLGFFLTVHETLHVGQLSAWRRALGRDPLF